MKLRCAKEAITIRLNEKESIRKKDRGTAKTERWKIRKKKGWHDFDM